MDYLNLDEYINESKEELDAEENAEKLVNKISKTYIYDGFIYYITSLLEEVRDEYDINKVKEALLDKLNDEIDDYFHMK